MCESTAEHWKSTDRFDLRRKIKRHSQCTSTLLVQFRLKISKVLPERVQCYNGQNKSILPNETSSFQYTRKLPAQIAIPAPKGLLTIIVELRYLECAPLHPSTTVSAAENRFLQRTKLSTHMLKIHSISDSRLLLQQKSLIVTALNFWQDCESGSTSRTEVLGNLLVGLAPWLETVVLDRCFILLFTILFHTTYSCDHTNWSVCSEHHDTRNHIEDIHLVEVKNCVDRK